MVGIVVCAPIEMSQQGCIAAEGEGPFAATHAVSKPSALDTVKLTKSQKKKTKSKNMTGFMDPHVVRDLTCQDESDVSLDMTVPDSNDENVSCRKALLSRALPEIQGLSIGGLLGTSCFPSEG